MPNDYPIIADLTPAQLLAHKKIEVLLKVFDAAEEVSIAYDISETFTDAKSLNRYYEAMNSLEAELYNAKAVLKELRKEQENGN